MSIRAAVWATVTMVGLAVIVPACAWLLNAFPVPMAICFGIVCFCFIWYCVYLNFKDYE